MCVGVWCLAMRLAIMLLCVGGIVGIVVPLDTGRVRGIEESTHVSFFGIPFAQPPIGALRFQSPQPVLPWSGIRNATVRQPGCPQLCVLPQLECPVAVSEDCLFLDVFVPLGEEKRRPVLFFIAGGAFMQGAANVDLYDGGPLANKTNTIVITAEYRLGALGFLVWEGHGERIAGNFGLEDQRLALQWVQRNVEQFGGDPTKVTVFGQSAGAMSIGVHLISPPSKGLFHAAIMESNPLGLPYKTARYQSKWGTSFAKHVGRCTSIACLQAAPLAEVLKAQKATFHLVTDILEMALAWTPNVDGLQFPMTPLAAFKAGLPDANVPVIMGTVADEGLIFVKKVISGPVGYLEYVGLVTALFGVHVERVLALYPPSSVGFDKSGLLASLVTDYVFECPSRYAATLMKNQMHVYRFDHVMSFSKFAWGQNYSYCYDHVCHGEELPFVFDTVAEATNGVYDFTPAEAVLSRTMQTMWGNMAHVGNPNGPNAGIWPTFAQAKGRTNIVFKTGDLSIDVDHHKTKCAVFESIGFD